MLLTLILFFYAAFFYKPSLVEEKTKKIQITKSHLQAKNKPTKKILLSDVTTVKPVIKDSLFATVGNKAITYSDIVNEIKVILIISNENFSEEKRKQIETAAINSTIKRNIKKIEIEKYKFLKFNQNDLDREIKNSARKLNMNLETFKNTFIANGIDFSNIIEQYKVELLWNSLIFQLYKDRLSINQDEINEQLKLIQKTQS